MGYVYLHDNDELKAYIKADAPLLKQSVEDSYLVIFVIMGIIGLLLIASVVVIAVVKNKRFESIKNVYQRYMIHTESCKQSDAKYGQFKNELTSSTTSVSSANQVNYKAFRIPSLEATSCHIDKNGSFQKVNKIKMGSKEQPRIAPLKQLGIISVNETILKKDAIKDMIKNKFNMKGSSSSETKIKNLNLNTIVEENQSNNVE